MLFSPLTEKKAKSEFEDDNDDDIDEKEEKNERNEEVAKREAARQEELCRLNGKEKTHHVE